MDSPQKKTNPDKLAADEAKLLPIRFITEKDSSFRTFHADGVWGMANVSGNIQLNFFIEHHPLPEAVIYDGGEMEVIEQKDDEHIIVMRNYQAAIVLSIDSARSVHTILGNFIKVSENMTKSDENE